MIVLIISWLVLFCVFFAYGDIAGKIIAKVVGSNNNDTAIRVFLGMAVLGISLMYISIFYPLNVVIFGISLIIPCIYWCLNRSKIETIAGNCKRNFLHLSYLDRILITVACTGIVIFALSAPLSYDMDLYHLQTMQWTSEYKAIPGLGNLHGRLAFNSSSLLLATLFFYNIKEIVFLFPLNSFATLVLTMWIFTHFKDSVVKRYNSVAILLVFVYLMGMTFSSTSTDVLANVFVLFIALYVLEKQQSKLNTNYIYILTLSVFCITLKLSSGLILLIPFLLFVRNMYVKENNKPFYLGLSIGLSFIMLLPWFIRYVILSGYLIYPFDAIDIFSVDWKMPVSDVIEEKESAYAWARIPFQPISKIIALPFRDWFPVWFSELRHFRQTLFCLAFISPLSILFFSLRKKLSFSLFYIWLVGFCGTVFLMFTAPDLRFGIGFVLLAAFSPYFCVFIDNFSKVSWIRYSALFILLAFGTLIIKNSIGQIKLFQPYTNNSISKIVFSPQENKFRDKDVVHLEFALENGFKVKYPTIGDKCFDNPLPCADGYKPNLRFRGTSIQDGFVTKQNNE